MTDGKSANRNGLQQEGELANLFASNGYADIDGKLSVKQKAKLFNSRVHYTGKWFSRQLLCGNNIYGSPVRADVFVYGAVNFPDGLIIESKWQQVGGSVDEKYPFLVETVKLLAIPTIVVLDGNGYRLAAADWLRSQVAVVPSLAGVYTYAEFKKAVNKKLLG